MRKSLFVFLISILTFSNQSNAEEVVGYDLLALQHPNFPFQKVVSAIPENSALGVLLDTFGDDRSRISEALKSGKFRYFRIHLANGPGLRNRQLGEYENLFGLNVKSFEKKIISDDAKVKSSFIERAKYVNSLATQYPNAKCFVSPVLEHNLSPESFSKLSAIVHDAAPNCQIVDNPVNGWGYQLQQDQILEVHGMEAPPSAQYIASQDGFLGAAEDFLKLHDKAFIKFIWKSSYNCRVAGKFIDPRSRSHCDEPN